MSLCVAWEPVSLACQLGSLGQALPRAGQAARWTGWPAPESSWSLGMGEGTRPTGVCFWSLGGAGLPLPTPTTLPPTPSPLPGMHHPMGLHRSGRGKVLDSDQLLRAQTGCPPGRMCPPEPAGLVQSRAEPARVRASVWSSRTPGPVLGSSWRPSGPWLGVPSCHPPSQDRDSRLRVRSQKLGLSPESDSRVQRNPAGWVEPTLGRTPVPCQPGLGAGGSACANNPCGIWGSCPHVPEERTHGPPSAQSQ